MTKITLPNVIAATIIVVFMLLFVIFFAMEVSFKDGAPQAKDGELDLSAWNFDQDGNVKLDGYWEFYPNALLSPNDIEDGSDTPVYMHVPSRWSNAETEYLQADQSIGTYQLRIKVPITNTLYGIKTTYIRNASILYVDGNEVGRSGNPSAAPDLGYVSRNTPIVAFFPVDGDQMTITVQVANLDYYYGGIIQSIYLGTQENIIEQSKKHSLLDMMGIAFLLISGVYYFGIYLRRPLTNSFLYFSIFCFAYTLIVMTSSERLFMQFFTFIPYMTVLKIKMVLIGLSLCCFGLFIWELARAVIPRGFLKIILIVIFIICVFTILLPTEYYSISEVIIAITVLFVFFSIGIFIIRSLVTKQYGRLNRTTTILLLLVVLLLIIQFGAMMMYLYSMINTNIIPILSLLFFLLGIAYIFADQYSRTYDDLEDMSNKLIEALKFETLFLQSQIKPHFIYNVLSIIMSLCYSDGRRAGKLLGDFSNYLRLSFDLDPHHSMVNLRRELSMVKSYITLEEARFGDRLHVEMVIDDGLMEVPIPALVLQPLVENAIRHGVMKRVVGGKVTIQGLAIEHGMQITVEDDGVGIAEPKLATLLNMTHMEGSVGLKNVHRRLINEFGQGLHIESVEGKGTKVTIHIPYQLRKAKQVGEELC